MVEKYGFIYVWFDRKRKMFYIGSHWGTTDDGYICSSNRMRDAYRRRPQDFKRRILKSHIEKQNILDEEHKWLRLIKDSELGKKYYNLRKHKWGHWSTDTKSSLTVKEKISFNTKNAMNTPEMREKMRPIWEANRGRVQSEEEKQKRAKSNTGKKRTEETKHKISESNKGRVMGPLSDEHRKKVSEALKGEKNPFYGKQHGPELKKRINEKTSQTMKGRKPANLDMFKGSLWWNNGAINKRSKDCPGEVWIRGRVST